MLSRDIGQKFFGDVGPVFGIVTTSAFGISEGKEEEEAALLYTLHKRGAKTFWNFLEYSPVNPSGPGDLKLGNL